MPDLDRPRLGLYLALGLIVCALGARELRGAASPRPAAGGAPAPSAGGAPFVRGAPPDRPGAEGDGLAGGPSSVRLGTADGGRVTVHVAGAVRRPGVYRLGPGARVDDALRRAGGPTRRADTTAVNLAAKLDDGRQVLVPERVAAGRAPPAAAPPAGGRAPGGATASAGGATPSAGGPTPAAPGAAAPGGAAPGAGAPPINLNTATLEQLDTLDGVGPGIAQRILGYRAEHGGFRRVEELAQVPGIGPKRLAALTPRVTV